MSFVPKKVLFSLPFGIGSVEWQVDETQSRRSDSNGTENNARRIIRII